MAANDIKVIKNGYGIQEFIVEDRDTSSASYTIKPGEPTKKSTNVPIILADGEMRIGSGVFIGIATTESTETKTVNGVVKIEMVGPGTILRGGVTTTGNMNTAAELLAVKMNCVNFDLTTVYFTIDENEASDPNNNGLCILDGDIDKGTVDVAVHANTTLFAPIVGETMD